MYRDRELIVEIEKDDYNQSENNQGLWGVRTPRTTPFLCVPQIEDDPRENPANRSYDSDEDIRLSESDCEESEESADVIDNIPVNPNVYVARDGNEWIPYNSNVPGRFRCFPTKRLSNKLRET
ncbi:hypothetical protein TNCV_5021321 [Trichonephila clavipes]|nr:hypothetical protein TNCV_5021321 [Trichonephila clavipes]